MSDAKLQQLRDIIRSDPTLIWYSTNYDGFDVETIIEAVLNYGSWKQFLELKKILGHKLLANEFRNLDTQPRSNLLPIYRHYFRLYFSHYAS